MRNVRTLFVSTATLLTVFGTMPTPQAHARMLHTVSTKSYTKPAIAVLWKSTQTILDHLFFDKKSKPVTPASQSWDLPAPPIWPIDEQGQPVVSTERVHELWHTISRGKNLYWILKAYKTRLSTLKKLNPKVQLRTLKPGDRVLVWRRNKDKTSVSTGDPSRGRLKHGEVMPTGKNYALIHTHRSFGTYYTVSEITRVMRAYEQSYPEAEPLLIGDLSYRTGKRITPHLSHQSGRDVDITYPRKSYPPTLKKFSYIRRRDLDVERTLWIIREFLASGMTEHIFIDRPIQRMLYNKAKKLGAPTPWLKAVFQYPKYSGTHAIIRRSPGHDDHMHIRFSCQSTDKRCPTHMRPEFIAPTNPDA